VFCACIATRAAVGGFIRSSRLTCSLYAADSAFGELRIAVVGARVQLEGRLRVYRVFELLPGSPSVVRLGEDDGNEVASAGPDGLFGSPRLSDIGIPGVGVAVVVLGVPSLVGVIHARGSTEEYLLGLEDILQET
jgi:hypothetical protein